MTIRWPDNVLRPQNVAFNIAPRSLAGPTSVSGKTQVISSDAGIWKATYGSIIVKSRAAVITHRAISAILEGRLGTILVPLCRAYQPVPSGAVTAGLYDQIPHSDESLFDDDTGYIGQVINVSTTGGSVGAVAMTVTANYAGTLEPGQHFSVGERLYRIRSYDEDTGAMTFRPPLREAVASGTQLNFDDPVCRMRLVSDNEMDLDLALRRFSSPTVNFVEDV